jgi:ABC-2 type transport system ATP-binding protein
MSDAVVSVQGLVKRYGDLEAVAGVDLEVRRGEIFAFLGPNGAGKTTAVEILEGYRPRTAGAVSVLGADPQEGGRAWRAQIGIVLQTGATEEALTPRETFALWASYYPEPRPVEEVVALVGLEDRADQRISALSGGQKRRVEVGLALVGAPELVFLDEPTTGFDPEARRHFWKVIGELGATGTTIFLTTHYLEEAQALADRVAIIKSGRIAAMGTPAELSTRAGGAIVSFRLPAGVRSSDLPADLPGSLEAVQDRVSLHTEEPTQALGALAAWASASGTPELAELTVARPSLEDVYLELVR